MERKTGLASGAWSGLYGPGPLVEKKYNLCKPVTYQSRPSITHPPTERRPLPPPFDDAICRRADALQRRERAQLTRTHATHGLDELGDFSL